MRKKQYQWKFVHLILIRYLCYGLAFIVNKKWKNKIYKLGKNDGRVPQFYN